jgi:hypothetical protein
VKTENVIVITNKKNLRRQETKRSTLVRFTRLNFGPEENYVTPKVFANAVDRGIKTDDALKLSDRLFEKK